MIMWDDEGFETSDSVRETVNWMDELRAQEINNVRYPDAVASVAARLRPKHTLTWAIAELVCEARKQCADVTFRNELELIAHVRNVVSLTPTVGAGTFYDAGDELSVAYLVVLRATDDDIEQLMAELRYPIHVDDDTYACVVCGGGNWVDTPTDWHCDDCGARHNVPLGEIE